MISLYKASYQPTLSLHPRHPLSHHYYFPPPSSLSQALSSTPAKLEKDVASLITRGQLPARIDSHTKTLHRTQQEV